VSRLAVLPPDATLDTPFRCDHFACTLAVKHCLRRQTDRRRGNAGVRDGVRLKWSKPLHEFCASGACEQGAEIRARFPDARPEQARDPRCAPRMDIVRAVEEANMPKGIRTEPCPKCGSKSTRCPDTCPTRARGGKGAKPPASPRGRRGRGAGAGRELDTDALLVRREELLLELADVDQRLRDRLATEEAKLERMRQAIAATASAAREAAA